MYYATELFIKKGALGKIWLAGTLFKKLSKKDIIDSDISELCRQVSSPPIPLAISTCGKLTFGIVRIHEYHVILLSKYAHESYSKLIRFISSTIQQKRNNQINLPSSQLCANIQQITMQTKQVQLPLIDYDNIEIQLLEQQAIHPTTIDKDLLAHDGDITLPQYQSTVAATSVTLIQRERERRRGFDDVESDLGLDADLDLDLDLNLGFDSDKDSAFDDDDDGVEQQFEEDGLPIPSGSVASLPEISASAVIQPSIPIQQPVPSLIPIIDIEPQQSLSPITPSPRIQPIQAIQPIQSIQEDITQIDIGDRRIRKRKKRKRKRKRKFHRDPVIEYEQDELLMSSSDIPQHTIDRPHFSHIADRPLGTGEFEELFTRSLTGIYANNALENTFREFTNYILNPSDAQQRINRDKQQVEIGRGEPIQPSLIMDQQIQPVPMDIDHDISIPEQPYAASSIQSSLVIQASSIGDDEPFLGIPVDKYPPIASSSSIQPVSIKKKGLLLRDLSDISSIDLHDIDIDIDDDDDERKKKLELLKKKKDIITSSEELTVPNELTKLSIIFKKMIDNEIRKKESELIDDDIDNDDIDIKINLEELLKNSAADNDTQVTKRDVALGFMQTLLLKNADIIEVEQDNCFDPIYLSKGPDFYKPINQ